MNLFEQNMVHILTELRTRFGATAVRAEFETEGTRLEDLLRLKEVSTRAGLGLTLKIGGCESVRDLLDARVVGIRSVSAPMIESGFALQKYVRAVQKVFPAEEMEDLDVLANVETRVAFDRLPDIVRAPEAASVRAFVIERVDLCASFGLDSDAINHPDVAKRVDVAVRRIGDAGHRVIVGGGVSAHSLPFLRSLPSDVLVGFETRKVTFDARRALAGDAERGILYALAFEVFHLKSKKAFFRAISTGDENRLETLERRYWAQITRALG